MKIAVGGLALSGINEQLIESHIRSCHSLVLAVRSSVQFYLFHEVAPTAADVLLVVLVASWKLRSATDTDANTKVTLFIALKKLRHCAQESLV